MKPGIYLVTDKNGNLLGLVRFTGVEPMLKIEGTVNTVEFNRSGKLQEISKTNLKSIETKPSNFNFRCLETMNETIPDTELEEAEIQSDELQEYRDFLHETLNLSALIQFVMKRRQISWLQAENFLKYYGVIK